MSETNDTGGPGNEPRAIGNPISSVLEAPRFNFPSRAPIAGPLGPVPGDRDPRKGSPLLGVPSAIRAPRNFQLHTSLGTPVSVRPLEVYKPTALLLTTHDLVAADVSINLLYFPGVSFEPFLDDNNGFKWVGNNIFLWAPGRWYVGAIVTTAIRTLQFMMIETEHPQVMDNLLDQRGCFISQNSDVALTAATITTLLDLPGIMRARRVTLTNVGANVVRWTYGGANPSATRGGFLAANGGTIVLEGPNLSMQQIRGFSTSGSSVAVEVDSYPWVL